MAGDARNSTGSGYTILVVDDQEAVLWSMRRLLRRAGHTVVTASSASEALAVLAEQHVHVVLVDYVMPRMSAEQLVPKIRERDARIRVILQTGYAGSKPPRETLRALDIHGYHDKTEGPEKLLIWVDVATQAYDQMQRLSEATEDRRRLAAIVARMPGPDPASLATRIEALRCEANTMRACAELLLDTPLRPEQARVADMARAHAATQLALIDDVMHLARGMRAPRSSDDVTDAADGEARGRGAGPPGGRVPPGTTGRSLCSADADGDSFYAALGTGNWELPLRVERL
jgi:CheY-like chemotaxis protein